MNESSPLPIVEEIPSTENEAKEKKPWYRGVFGRCFGTATLYLKKPMLPPLVEYQNLLFRRNALDYGGNHLEDGEPPRGAEAYLRQRAVNVSDRNSNSFQTGSEVKVLRRLRLWEGEENLRPCMVDIGLGGCVKLDPSVKIEPMARVRFVDCVTMKFTPKPVLKISKKLPFHWQGMQAHLRYEVPLARIKDSWWRPPARMLIRFEHGSNTGFHVYPGGLEFGDHTIPLTKESTVALRVAAGITFPREYPVRPGNDPQWEVHRLGIKTIW